MVQCYVIIRKRPCSFRNFGPGISEKGQTAQGGAEQYAASMIPKLGCRAVRGRRCHWLKHVPPKGKKTPHNQYGVIVAGDQVGRIRNVARVNWPKSKPRPRPTTLYFDTCPELQQKNYKCLVIGLYPAVKAGVVSAGGERNADDLHCCRYEKQGSNDAIIFVWTR